MVVAILIRLDELRRACLRPFGRHVGAWAARRDVRVAVLGIAAITMALAGALLAPTWLLALGPIVLGVPHLLADARYLVARPGLHRRGLATLAVAAALAAGAVTSRLAWGLAAALVATWFAEGPWRRRAVSLGCLIPLFAAAVIWRGYSELAFAHAHNAIAVALWWTWRPRRSRWHLAPLALFLAASAALATGTLDFIWRSAALPLPGLGTPMRAHVRTLAPHLSGDLGIRLVLLFAFAQSVHYAIWLRLIPEDDRPRPAPRTFVGSYRALTADLGWPLVALAAVASGALVLWACVDLAAARSGYLRFAGFHGYLELAAAAWLFVEGRRLDDPSERQSSKRPRDAEVALACP